MLTTPTKITANAAMQILPPFVFKKAGILKTQSFIKLASFFTLFIISALSFRLLC